MINEAHDLLYEKIKFHYPDQRSKREVLRNALKNYRVGKGMSLSFEAFKYLDDNNFYTFLAYPRPRIVESKELIWFDRISPSPYYVGKTEIYISDPVHQFTFEMVESFEDFILFLKA